ncbi:type A2 lantipeptide [Dolichospermum flos-aquae]|uniref:Type A2 lantipeptide n=1 Tax=Dolichospermum flos-aquae CCAP 1403/13F TaxID=315271 RepID=A0A6H2BUP8_DOLFA|nr:type A2 lantipeptide [Dolichospermum flos-aquae]QJB42821.1 type A2 lantipeptide [Dolichospermum flos-aquae CCAP 1403/13F]
MANIQIFEINEDGELLVNDPALAGALQELKPEEINMIVVGGKDTVVINKVKQCGCTIIKK